MKPTSLKPGASPAFAERIGRMLGRAWRGVLRRERNACAWLTAQGLPPGIAQALPLLLKLAVLGVALYVVFWVALLLGLAVVTAWALERCIPSKDFELQFPTLEELRQMPGYDPNFYDDTSHEMYRIHD